MSQKHNNEEHDPECACGCGHDTHAHHHTHDKESCPVCSGHEIMTHEEYLNRIEESVGNIPLKEKRERKNRLITLSAATAATAAEHKDSVLLQIIEVYLTLRLADESGIQIDPEDGIRLFRDLSGTVGLGLTAKYGLEGLTKVDFDPTQKSRTASLVFITCYGIGKLLAAYYKKHIRGLTLNAEEAKEIFQSAKTEAERLTLS